MFYELLKLKHFQLRSDIKSYQSGKQNKTKQKTGNLIADSKLMISYLTADLLTHTLLSRDSV